MNKLEFVLGTLVILLISLIMLVGSYYAVEAQQPWQSQCFYTFTGMVEQINRLPPKTADRAKMFYGKDWIQSYCLVY